VPQIPDTKLIVIENLQKSLQGKKVLDGLNLDVQAGETRVIVGGSGEGKSVLLKHIVGLLVPDAGRVIVDGIELDPFNPKTVERIRERTAMVFQGAALFDSLNVRGNVAFALINRRKLADNEIDRIVREKLKHVNLAG